MRFLNMINIMIYNGVATTGLQISDGTSYVNDFLNILSKIVILGGAIYTLWGVVGLGLAIKDHNSNDIQGSIFKALGGAIVVIAGYGFGRLTL